jgi:hypothetical protein
VNKSGPVLLGIGVIVLVLAIIRHFMVHGLFFDAVEHAAVYMALVGVILIAAGAYIFRGRTA